MKKYILNSAVMTTFGIWHYVRLNREQAHIWASTGDPISTVGYEQTAQELEQIIEIPVAVDRRVVVLEPGDQALVFRLVFPPNSPRINPEDKGKLSAAILAGHYELGLITRLK